MREHVGVKPQTGAGKGDGAEQNLPNAMRVPDLFKVNIKDGERDQMKAVTKIKRSLEYLAWEN